MALCVPSSHASRACHHRVEHSPRMLPDASTGRADPSRPTPGVPMPCKWTPHTQQPSCQPVCFSDSEATGCPDPSVTDAITGTLCCRAQSGPRRGAFQRQAMCRSLRNGLPIPGPHCPTLAFAFLGSSLASQASGQMQPGSPCSCAESREVAAPHPCAASS